MPEANKAWVAGEVYIEDVGGLVMPGEPQKTLLKTYTGLIQGVQGKIFCVKCYMKGMHRHGP